MKQCIDVKNLKSLKFKQQATIATLFGQYGNCARIDSEGNEHLILPMLAERITMGKMIEVLGDKLYCMTQDKAAHSWHIIIGEWNGLRIDKTELVDCLWEAIKKDI